MYIILNDRYEFNPEKRVGGWLKKKILPIAAQIWASKPSFFSPLTIYAAAWMLANIIMKEMKTKSCTQLITTIKGQLKIYHSWR